MQRRKKERITHGYVRMFINDSHVASNLTVPNISRHIAEKTATARTDAHYRWLRRPTPYPIRPVGLKMNSLLQQRMKLAKQNVLNRFKKKKQKDIMCVQAISSQPACGNRMKNVTYANNATNEHKRTMSNQSERCFRYIHSLFATYVSFVLYGRDTNTRPLPMEFYVSVSVCP